MDGFYGRFLKINLTDNHFDVVTLTEEILLKYLGGKGAIANIGKKRKIG